MEKLNFWIWYSERWEEKIKCVFCQKLNLKHAKLDIINVKVTILIWIQEKYALCSAYVVVGILHSRMIFQFLFYELRYDYIL